MTPRGARPQITVSNPCGVRGPVAWPTRAQGLAVREVTRAASCRELKAEYRRTAEGYQTWPFRPTAVSGVGITAGLPLLGNLAVIIYRIVWAP